MSLIEPILEICRDAGEAIMKVYRSDFVVEEKADASPLTLADRASHEIITESLSRLFPDIPVLSEEGKEIPLSVRQAWGRFWLVDPLDGTKEFVKRNGEFTVNIALIEDGFPVFGAIYVPVDEVAYCGYGDQAFRIRMGCGREPVRVRPLGQDTVAVVESRSHPSAEMAAYIRNLQPRAVNRIERGSSLKFCAVAEGVADVYPRLGPTMEWDTAAGQAILEAAGGMVLTPQGKRFRYNKADLRNESFFAVSDRSLLPKIVTA